MRNFAPASPTPSPFLAAPSHLALTGRQSLCLILILSVSNHYSSLKAPQNLTANNHNEALKARAKGGRRSWGVGVGEVGTGCGTGVAPAINVAAAASASVSTSGWVSSARCLLCRLSVVAGGCQCLSLSLRAATSATCSASCCCCCLSTVWFLLLCFCVWFARGKVNNSSKRQQNLLNYYLPLLLYLTLHATQAGVPAKWRRRPCRRNHARSLAERGCNPLSQAKFTFTASREKVTRWNTLQNLCQFLHWSSPDHHYHHHRSRRMRSPRIEIISAVTGTSINGDFCTFKCRNSH